MSFAQFHVPVATSKNFVSAIHWHWYVLYFQQYLMMQSVCFNSIFETLPNTMKMDQTICEKSRNGGPYSVIYHQSYRQKDYYNKLYLHLCCIKRFLVIKWHEKLGHKWPMTKYLIHSVWSIWYIIDGEFYAFLWVFGCYCDCTKILYSMLVHIKGFYIQTSFY